MILRSAKLEEIALQLEVVVILAGIDCRGNSLVSGVIRLRGLLTRKGVALFIPSLSAVTFLLKSLKESN